MPTLQIFQIDAFTRQVLRGNPAAVIPLQNWLPDTQMQAIAQENNLAETAFFIPLDSAGQYHIRWFTPTTEVDLCGHATLATAYVLFNCLNYEESDIVSFQSRSGWLHVTKQADWLELDFPADHLEPSDLSPEIIAAIGAQPLSIWKGREDYLLEFGAEADVLALQPDFRTLATLPSRGFIATAPGSESDFVSRCFYPAFGIDEDPVTGSAHTTLTPFWANKLNKTQLSAIQVSSRRGYLRCTLAAHRVRIAGQAVLFLEGICRIP